MKKLLDDVRSYIEPRLDAHRSEAASPLVCVAWSGGLDSTVLLDALDRLRSALGLELAAIHVEHGLREDSSDDAALCRKIAGRRHIPLVVEHLEVRRNSSPEAQARYQRYAALWRAAARLRATHLATAHHADDAIETALLNWVRGSGAQGLSSLAGNTGQALRANPAPSEPETHGSPLPDDSPFDLIRPLANHSRETIAEYAERVDLAWRDDPTNAERDATRNRLRRDVVPALRREAGSTAPLVRTLENLADDARGLQSMAAPLVEPPPPGEGRDCRAFETKALVDAPASVAAAALRKAARDLHGPVGMHRTHIDRLLATAASALETTGDESPRKVSVPGGLLLVGADRTLLYRSRKRGGADLAERSALPIHFRLDTDGNWQSLRWFEWRFAWRRLNVQTPPEWSESKSTVRFDAAALPDELTLRGPKPGEGFAAFGLDGTKSVADTLRDGDVNPAIRWRWPVLARPDRDPPDACLWIGGLRRSSHAPLGDSTRRVLELRLERFSS